jgi:DNA-binding response OmpR family regulator
VAGVALALRDVTAQRELEERKTELVQVVSHELRTPLTAIRGAIDLVLGGAAGNLQPKQAHFLGLARDSVQKLNGIVDDLLDLGKASRGQLRVTPQVCWLDEVVREAVQKFAAPAAERNLRIHSCPPDAPVRVVADPQRLGQVLANVLQNAIKFAPEGTAIEVAVLQSRGVEGWAGFSVWNGGEHIPEEDLERIFGKFEQARTEATRRAGGAGLGLAICKALVEAHGGRMWAESAPGKGVRMTVALPVEPPEEAGGAVDVDAAAPASAEEAPLLLIVDERATAELVRGIAATRSLRCAVATTREEALALARRLRPRAACVDLLAHGLEGAALAEIWRHDPETRDMPLLVFSAPEERERAFRVGATAFVPKPAQAGQLASALEAVVRGSGAGEGSRVLVVEDDPTIRAVAAEALESVGYRVETAATCAEARVAVREKRPDLVLSDVNLPDGDGFSLLDSLRDERASFPFGLMFLSARTATADKVRGFRAGADDYVTKPFEAAELIARVEAVLRRREASLSASPVTRLPGGKAIEREVERRLEAQVPFRLAYLDLDNFKAFNDHYGFAKGDAVMLQTADLLREVVYSVGGDGAFVGHIGGDDFVFIAPEPRAEEVCAQVISRFDRIIPLYYDREDRERGYIEADDRYGQRRRFPVMSVSVVSVRARPGRTTRHADLVKVAAELKGAAKAHSGSVHVGEDGVITPAPPVAVVA